MRHITFAAGLAFAVAATFATAPARAEFGGPLINEQGQCRQYGPENQNLTYYYWDKCPSQITHKGHTHAIRVTIPHHHS
jgi:hypothetical protein